MKPDIVCKGWKNFLGLMFRKEKKTCLLTSNKAKKWSIHTWFCHHPLNIYFLNEQGVVVEKTTMKPWRMYTSRKKAHYALETPLNTENYEVGQRIELGNT